MHTTSNFEITNIGEFTIRTSPFTIAELDQIENEMIERIGEEKYFRLKAFLEKLQRSLFKIAEKIHFLQDVNAPDESLPTANQITDTDKKAIEDLAYKLTDRPEFQMFITTSEKLSVIRFFSEWHLSLLNHPTGFNPDISTLTDVTLFNEIRNKYYEIRNDSQKKNLS